MKVTLSCGKIKKISRQMFSGHWAACFLAVFIQWALIQLPQILVSYLTQNRIITTVLESYVFAITGPLTLDLIGSDETMAEVEEALGGEIPAQFFRNQNGIPADTGRMPDGITG